MDDERTTPRRAVLRSGLAAAAAVGAVSGLARRAAAQEKLAQNMVMYQDHPNNGARCSACAQYIDPNNCKIVQGPIVANGWCAAFTPKG